MGSVSTQRSKQRWLSLSIATALMLVLLHWSFRDLNWAIVSGSLRQARWSWLVFGLGAYLFSYGLRAWRWGLLLGNQSGPLKIRIAALFVGYAGNSFLPFSAGEVVRAGLLHRQVGVPFQPALGSILAERLLDVWVVFLLLIMGVNQLLQQTGQAITLPLAGIALVMGSASAAIWLAARYPNAIAKLAGQLASQLLSLFGRQDWSHSLESALRGLLQGLCALRRPRRFAAVFLLSWVIWLTNGLIYWATLQALQMTQPGLAGALLAQSLTAFAMILPSTPGYVGPFEAAIRLVLDWFGVSRDLTVAYALMLRFLMYLVTPLIGIIIALRLGLSGAELQGRPPRTVNPSNE